MRPWDENAAIVKGETVYTADGKVFIFGALNKSRSIDVDDHLIGWIDGEVANFPYPPDGQLFMADLKQYRAVAKGPARPSIDAVNEDLKGANRWLGPLAALGITFSIEEVE